MSDKKQVVLDRIEENKDLIIKYTQELIQFPSTAGKEEDAQVYFSNILKEMNLEVDMWQPMAEDMKINPNFLALRDDYQGSPNVVGTLNGKGGGKSIILNGHMDVVPASKADWDASPWSGKLEDGKIYGRGAVDMKGGIIANTMAVKAIIDAGIKLKGDVFIESVIGEETGGAGTLSAIHRGYKADGAIVPEPTDFKLCPVSMGVTWFRVKIKGKAAHAATAYVGVNAISKANLIIDAIDQLDTDRKMTIKHELYEYHPAPFSINMGTIKGGNFPTIVPDEVVIEARISCSPDEGISKARKAVEDAIQKVANQDEWLSENKPIVEWYGFCLEGGSIPKDHALVKALANNYKDIKNEDPKIIGTPFGTDAGALINYGDTPTIVFGPGPGETAHKANEYIDVDDLIKTTKIIAATIMDWCGY